MSGECGQEFELTWKFFGGTASWGGGVKTVFGELLLERMGPTVPLSVLSCARNRHRMGGDSPSIFPGGGSGRRAVALAKADA
jgi:hypothetical protein